MTCLTTDIKKKSGLRDFTRKKIGKAGDMTAQGLGTGQIKSIFQNVCGGHVSLHLQCKHTHLQCQDLGQAFSRTQTHVGAKFNVISGMGDGGKMGPVWQTSVFVRSW